jgi:transposase
MNGGREIFLIVDRGSAHRAKKAGNFRVNLGSKLRLFFRPPYAPERKPDALVWKHRKAGRMAVIATDDFAKKVRRVFPAFYAFSGAIRSACSAPCRFSA